jgi:hypothetical protein
MGATLPDEVRLSVTIDREHAVMIAGGGGAAQVVPMTTKGGAFRAGGTIVVSIPCGGVFCDGVTGVNFEALALTPGASTLSGTGMGTADFVVGDLGSELPFTATLTGGDDVTAPFLISHGLVDNPFVPFELQVSEPLPETAKADLVDPDGNRIALEPVFGDGKVKIVTEFRKPDVVLPFVSGFTASVDGLVDFAGNSGAAGAPLRIVAFPAPPVIAADGFESATGTVGGAAIVGAGSIPAISGTASAYFGMGAPTPDGVKAGTGLFVRIPRRATDSKVVFSYRVVASDFPTSFNGFIFAGSVGGSVAQAGPFPQVNDPVPLVTTATPIVAASPVLTMEIPLTDRVEGEVAVMIGEFPAVGLLERAGREGLLVDDLRAE